MDILNYKGYEGTAELDMSRALCRGKILFISDLVTYEANSPAELRQAFEAAVDDYLETCAVLGREPKKPCTGVFNVRISPEMHRKAILRSITDDVALNSVVVSALATYLNQESRVNHNVEVTVKMEGSTLQTVLASSALPTAEIVPLGSLYAH